MSKLAVMMNEAYLGPVGGPQRARAKPKGNDRDMGSYGMIAFDLLWYFNCSSLFYVTNLARGMQDGERALLGCKVSLASGLAEVHLVTEKTDLKRGGIGRFVEETLERNTLKA